REIGGQGRAETALAHAAGKRPPVLAAVPERPLRDPALQAALLELEADPHRALALADAGPDQAFGEAGVVLEAFRREPLHRLAGGLRLEAVVEELRHQLGAAVVAPREAIHGLAPRRPRVAAVACRGGGFPGRVLRGGHASLATGSASLVA